MRNIETWQYKFGRVVAKHLLTCDMLASVDNAELSSYTPRVNGARQILPSRRHLAVARIEADGREGYRRGTSGNAMLPASSMPEAIEWRAAPYMARRRMEAE